MKGNKLIKILAIVVVSIVLIILIINGRANKAENIDSNQTALGASPDLMAINQGPDQDDNGLGFDPMSDTELEEKLGVDVDSPEETMRTLTRELQTVRKEAEQIAQENKELRREAGQLLNMEDTLTTRMDSKMSSAEKALEAQKRALAEQAKKNQSLMARLEQRLKDAERRAATIAQGKPGASNPTSEGYDIGMANIPAGLGFKSSRQGSDGVIWKQPLDAVVDTKSGSLTMPKFDDISFSNPAERLLPQGREVQGRGKKDVPQSVKAYTLPANATLIGSTSMTALLGRIPVDGQIPDPYPFKIIVGADNLSSNGINIPNIEGIKMSGIAKGDWTMSCVSGEIHSMTFTFKDGSISTYPPQTENAKPRKEAIAWFSDRYGIPCVSGKRITNAPSYLASRIGLGAISAYANVQAQQEYTNTTTSGPYGTSTSSTLTGDAGNAAKNQAIVGGTEEVIDWVEKRQQQSFDAIYVEPGTTLHVHMDRQIAIDYPINGSGRKVQHDEFINFQARTARALD